MRFLVSLTMTWLLVSPTPLTILFPHCLLSSLTASSTHARPCSSLAATPAHLPTLPPWRQSGSKWTYTSTVRCFFCYEILHGWVSLDDDLHVGGVASLATSMVARLLHRQAQPDLYSTVSYVVVSVATTVRLNGRLVHLNTV
jgi:hypothetical protein